VVNLRNCPTKIMAFVTGPENLIRAKILIVHSMIHARHTPAITRNR
jgi:hypothetical protein